MTRGAERPLLRFTGARTGIVAGYQGRLLRTADGGATWTEGLAPAYGTLGFVVDRYHDIHFPAPDTGYLAVSATEINSTDSRGYLLATRDGGTRWTRLPLELPGGVYKLHFPDPRRGCVVGEGVDSTGMPEGRIYATGDGGTTWRTHAFSGLRDLQAVHFPTARFGAVVGFGGAILITEDGGETWTRRQAPTTDPLVSVHFLDERRGFAGGAVPNDESATGFLLVTEDGGRTWSRPGPATLPSPVAAVQFLTPDVGYHLGHELRRTDDGGRTWVTISPGHDVAGFRFASRDTGYVVGTLFSMTGDGGKTWTRVTSSHLGYRTAVSLDGPRSGFAVDLGGGGRPIVRFRDYAARSVPVLSRRPASGLRLERLAGGRLAFRLPGDARVILRAVDPAGRLRGVLHDRAYRAGAHELALPARPCGPIPCWLDFQAGGYRQALPAAPPSR